MKSEAGRTKKRKCESARGKKHQCGTLSYLAECRGNGHKAASSRLPVPPDGMNRIVRRRPADK